MFTRKLMLCVVFISLNAVQAADLALDQAEKEFTAAVEKAKTEYEAKVKVARAALAARLKPLQDTATRRGDLDGAIKIRNRIAELKADDQRSHPAEAGLLSAFDGVWTISYRNGHIRKYAIKDGTVRFLEDRVGEKLHDLPPVAECRIQQQNKDFTVDFGDDLLEVIKLENGRLHVDLYNPKQSYPDGKPLLTASGIRDRNQSLSDSTK